MIPCETAAGFEMTFRNDGLTVGNLYINEMDALSLTLIVENEFAEIDRVNQAFRLFCEAHSIPDGSRRILQMVFDELLNNIISYAFRDKEKHFIEVRVAYSGTTLEVEILDDGMPFNPLQVPEPDLGANVLERSPGGLGIYLVKGMVDEVYYKRQGGQNKLRILKHI